MRLVEIAPITVRVELSIADCIALHVACAYACDDGNADIPYELLEALGNGLLGQALAAHATCRAIRRIRCGACGRSGRRSTTMSNRRGRSVSRRGCRWGKRNSQWSARARRCPDRHRGARPRRVPAKEQVQYGVKACYGENAQNTGAGVMPAPVFCAWEGVHAPAAYAV